MMVSNASSAAADERLLPPDHRFHKRLIRLFLWIERAAVEASGSEKSLILLDREHPSHDDTLHDVQESDGLVAPVTTETPLLSRIDAIHTGFHSDDLLATPNFVICSRNRCCRYVTNLLVLGLVLAVEAGYYVFPSLVVDKDATIRSLIRLDAFLLPLLMSFWFAAPMHTSLGYLSKNATLIECRINTEKLMRDRGARFFILLSLVTALGVVVVEIVLWIFKIGETIERKAIYIPYAAVSILIHKCTIYAHFLLIALALRGIQVRLNEIDAELDTQLDIFQRTNYLSVHPEYHPTLERWSESFHRLGQDIGHLSMRFGARMILAMSLFLVETANLISMVWQSDGLLWTRSHTALVLVVYLSNAAMLMMSLSAVCYPVSTCTQFIGPKLVVMAVREEIAIDDRTSRTCQVLANAFLLAPIEMVIGNLEVSPSVANSVAGVLAGLLLLVLGYKVPF